MRLLGVPAEQLALCLLVTAALTAAVFLPAIGDFGHVLLGKEDIQFFIWLFWHYGQSVAHGTDPFYAQEIYYPYGASLTASTVTPFQGALYLLLPEGWGVFGRITFLQVLSFILGGLFAFALAYRFTGSFMPSLTGSLVFDFSAFHFEKALHHLNYGMAMPFVALFFVCYYDALGQKPGERKLAWLALALLLVALNEMTIAVMAGFVVFVDILVRYARESRVALLSPRNMLVLCGGLVASLLLYEVSVAAGLPAAFVYVVPGALFVAVCLFAVLGWKNLAGREASRGFLASMSLCAIPAAAYLALLALHGAYAFRPDSVIDNLVSYPTPVDYLLVPSQLQQVSHLGVFQGLQAASETGVYLGPVVLLALLASWLAAGASEDEKRFRDMALVCILFSFPLITVGQSVLTVMVTPFIPGPMFPLLGFLRVPSRFMLFALVFISLAVALLSARLFSGRKNGTAMAAGLAALLLAASWPALGSFAFDPHVPQFYLGLAKTPGNASVFLYPDLGYYTLMDEVYYQTLHGDNLSCGILSRPPGGANALSALYDSEGNVTPQRAADVARSLGYDYVVVQKTRCTTGFSCFNGTFVPTQQFVLDRIRSGMRDAFGNETYEDSAVIVYDAKAGG